MINTYLNDGMLLSLRSSLPVQLTNALGEGGIQGSWRWDALTCFMDLVRCIFGLHGGLVSRPWRANMFLGLVRCIPLGLHAS